MKYNLTELGIHTVADYTIETLDGYKERHPESMWTALLDNTVDGLDSNDDEPGRYYVIHEEHNGMETMLLRVSNDYEPAMIAFQANFSAQLLNTLLTYSEQNWAVANLPSSFFWSEVIHAVRTYQTVVK